MSCIQLCTAVGSVVRLKQMLGRGSRIHPDKYDCLVLDHGGSVRRLGYWEDPYPWTLDTTSSSQSAHDVRPMIPCPQCKTLYRGGMCRKCGYEPTAKERRAEGLVWDGTELTEITRPKKSTSGQTPEKIMVSSLYRAARTNMTFSQAVMMAYRTAKQKDVPFTVPSEVTIGGRTLKMCRRGSADAKRRGAAIYP